MMKFLMTLLLGCALQNASDTELSELRDRADTIIEQEHTQEITTEQARRQVQLLLKDFEAWAKVNNVDLKLKSRTYASSPDGPNVSAESDEPLTVNRCPLFFEDDTNELCLIDLKRTEIWGVSILFCRYLCE